MEMERRGCVREKAGWDGVGRGRAGSGNVQAGIVQLGQGDPKYLKFLPTGPGQRDATSRMAISGFIALKGDTETGNFPLKVECSSKALVSASHPL